MLPYKKLQGALNSSQGTALIPFCFENKAKTSVTGFVVLAAANRRMSLALAIQGKTRTETARESQIARRCSGLSRLFLIKVRWINKLLRNGDQCPVAHRAKKARASPGMAGDAGLIDLQ